MLKALTIAKNQCVGQRRPLGSIQVTIWSLVVYTLWVKMNYGATLMSLLVHTHTHKTDVHILHRPGASTLVGAHTHNRCAHPPRARGLYTCRCTHTQNRACTSSTGQGPPQARDWQVFSKRSVVHALTWTGPWHDNKKVGLVLYLICSV